MLGDFAAKVKELGIHVRACVPYVKEQNGKVEVQGGHASDQVSVRLLDSQLPHDLWESARDHFLSVEECVQPLMPLHHLTIC